MRRAALIIAYIAALAAWAAPAPPRLDGLSLLQIKERGNGYARAEQWPQALYCYQTIVSRCKNGHTGRGQGEVCAAAWNNLGYVYFFGRADYSQAFQCFMQAQQAARQAGDEATLPYVDLNIANIYDTYKDADNAERHYRLAFDAACRLGLDDVAVTSVSNLCLGAMGRRRPRAALGEIARFERLRLPQATPGLPGARVIAKACKAMAAGHEAEAAALLASMRNPGEGTLTPGRLVALCSLLRATLLRHLGKLTQAVEALRATPPDSLPDDIRIDFLETESDILAAMGHADSAFSTHNKALKIGDSLYRRQSYGRIRDLRGDWEMRRAAEQLQQANERRAEAMRWAALAAAVALVIGALAVMLYINNKRLRQANKALYDKANEDLARYDAQLRQQQSQPASPIAPANPESPASAGAPDSDPALLAKITAALADEAAICTDDFTIDRLAKSIGSNSTYVSRAINAATGKNFAALLGEARVRLACRRLTDPAYARYTVEGIARELGFRSRTNFIAVFKKATGLTPTEYKRIGQGA